MSPLLAPTPAQIETRLDKLLQRHPDARVLGVRSPVRRHWPDVLERCGRRFRVAWCESELEVRERLDGIEQNAEEGVIILTPLDAPSLGSDILARLPRARLEETDRWSALRTAFHAHDVDPRLRAHRWLADLLLDRPPSDGYPPVPGGVLDLDTVWRTVQEQVLGLPEGRADVIGLLEWTVGGTGLERFAALSAEARRSIAERLAEAGGAASRLVLGAAMVGRGADALAVALACGVVFGEGTPDGALRDAAVRLEPFVGGMHLDAEAGIALADAGRRVLAALDRAEAAAVQTRTLVLVTEIRAESHIARSPALMAGLDARMRDAATALSLAASSGSMDDAERAWKLVRHVAQHDRANDERQRVERLTMAARLCRWLCGPSQVPATMAQAAAAYASDGCFADRARYALLNGDDLPEVAAAYAELQDRARGRRESETQAFARLFRDWNAAGSVGDDPLPIERVLDAVVAPLAREKPVLVLVLDGLALPVWRELSEALAKQGWMEITRPDQRSEIAVAALPTVTEVSRASLLCGRLTRGDQAIERAGFATHASLVAVSRAGHPPRLFHKGELGSGPELPIAVRDAIADPYQRVIGVIHNAVDAQLSGSDQLDLAWSSDALRQLMPLLRVARDAGRVVAITADHGHVIEAGTTQKAGGPGDRWRSGEGNRAGNGEAYFAGGRVLAPDGRRDVVVSLSERIRYATRRRGYHGGASPQEALVPVAILANGEIPRGWDAAPPIEPAWWRDVLSNGPQSPINPPRAALRAPNPTASPRQRPGDARQPELFGTPQATATTTPDSTTPVASAGTSPPPRWLDDLIGSEVYAAQRRLVGRGAPTDEQIMRMLLALIERGGHASPNSLAKALATPAIRIGGIVNAARRLLNVDQAQVLQLREDEVILEEGLLRLQFGLGRPR